MVTINRRGSKVLFILMVVSSFHREVDDGAVVVAIIIVNINVIIGVGLGVHVFIFLITPLHCWCSDLRLTLSMHAAAGDCRWWWEERGGGGSNTGRGCHRCTSCFKYAFNPVNKRNFFKDK